MNLKSSLNVHFGEDDTIRSFELRFHDPENSTLVINEMHEILITIAERLTGVVERQREIHARNKNNSSDRKAGQR